MGQPKCFGYYCWTKKVFQVKLSALFKYSVFVGVGNDPSVEKSGNNPKTKITVNDYIFLSKPDFYQKKRKLYENIN